jgi:hypothetical protein
MLYHCPFFVVVNIRLHIQKVFDVDVVFKSRTKEQFNRAFR